MDYIREDIEILSMKLLLKETMAAALVGDHRWKGGDKTFS